MVFLCPLDGVDLRIKDLAIDEDVVAKKLIKSYLTLELRGLTKHCRVTNVSDTL
jgi:hypothetical protein